MTAEQAYASARSWLEKEGGRIEAWISALQGASEKVTVWDRDPYKRIMLRFESVETG